MAWTAPPRARHLRTWCPQLQAFGCAGAAPAGPSTEPAEAAASVGRVLWPCVKPSSGDSAEGRPVDIATGISPASVVVRLS